MTTVNWKGSSYAKNIVSKIERIFLVCNWINCVWFKDSVMVFKITKMMWLSSSLPEDASTQVWVFLAQWLLRRLLKILLYVFQRKNLTPPPPNCGPTLPLGIMICRNLNQQYLIMRMLPYTFQLFWSNEFLEENFWKCQ